MDNKTLVALVVLLAFVCVAMAFVVKDQMDLIKAQRKYIGTLEDSRELLLLDLQIYKARLDLARRIQQSKLMGRIR